MGTIAITQDKLDCCVSYVKGHNGDATRQDLMKNLRYSEGSISILVKECKKLGLLTDTRAKRVWLKDKFIWIQSKLSVTDPEHKPKNYLEGWNGAPILGCYNTKRIYEGLHDYE